jgi:hypothetical protein
MLAGLGAIAFAVLTVVGVVVGGAPGGNYAQADAVNYVSIGHLPAVIVSGYLAMLGVLGLIGLLAFLREVIRTRAGSEVGSSVFWGAGLASAASLAVGWGLVSGIAVAAAEGGSANPGNPGGAATLTPAQTYMLSDTGINVLYGSGAILLGFALVVLAKASAGALPTWLRWLTAIVGVLAVASPAYFPAFMIPIWGVVIGVWLIAAGRLPLPARTVLPTT